MRDHNVFVLGAGVSREVGFPLGASLIANMANLGVIEPSDRDFNHDYFNMMNAGFESIDQGLRTEEFSHLKSKVMSRAASVLLSHESKELLIPYKAVKDSQTLTNFHNSSFRKLYQIWRRGLEDRKTFTFINFNYDRNLETYFWYTEAARRKLLLPDHVSFRSASPFVESQNALKQFVDFMNANFTVFHPYGRMVRSEYELSGAKETSYRYGRFHGKNPTIALIAPEPSLTKHQDKEALHDFETIEGANSAVVDAENLKIIGDTFLTYDQQSELRSRVMMARQTHFLGFAYAVENLRALGLTVGNQGDHPSDAFQGTGYGTSSEFREKIHADFNIKLSEQSNFDYLRSEFGV